MVKLIISIHRYFVFTLNLFTYTFSVLVSVAWFTFDPILSGPGLQYSEDSSRVTGEGWEHRVALGSVGFSRGIHYWEFTVDKYDADTDPAFGIARIDVTRDKMLGGCFSFIYLHRTNEYVSTTCQ